MQYPDFIYLASQSPRRAWLLEQAGIAWRPLVAEPDSDPEEDSEALEAHIPGESPARYVQRVAGLKLDAALARLKRRRLPPAPVLCADTTVAMGRRIFAKPDSDTDAIRMLSELSGATHRVLTAVAVQDGALRLRALNISRVRFAPLTPAQIRDYVRSGEPRGKAGAYAIQGRAAAFIEHISGSYSAIMGLPVFETAQILQHLPARLDP